VTPPGPPDRDRYSREERNAAAVMAVALIVGVAAVDVSVGILAGWWWSLLAFGAEAILGGLVVGFMLVVEP
jgi:hypothetical protein